MNNGMIFSSYMDDIVAKKSQYDVWCNKYLRWIQN
jgi:hypothetical protein